MDDDLRMIEVTEVGTSVTHTCWITKEFADKYEHAIRAFKYMFDEVDGKHSAGTSRVDILDERVDMALAWCDSRGESYSITEYMFDGDEFSTDDIFEILAFNEEINNTIEVKTRTEVTIGTEVFKL